jgi:ATP-dependent RNA helicase RhlE
MAFTALGLTDQLVQGILATGFTAPTEIQSRAIPLALTGKDIIGCAQTGTGKTAAFVLPILNRLSREAESHTHTHHIKSLILTPTRELAQQIEDAIAQYGRFTQIHALSIYGGTNINNQLKKLSRGVEIVIATPGRLLDHIARRSIDLSHIEVLVLDEADRMFDMGFIADVRKIVGFTPASRQTLLFSATMSREVRDLVKNIQHHPELIEVGEQRSAVKTVSQHFYSINQEKKMDLLLHMLQTQTLDSVLIFSRTKHGADKISHRLERKEIKSVAIHSGRTQAQRQRALAGFKQGHYQVLVATDVAARGIDVEGISHVINFDIPTFAEDYIHRIGRTARANATGDAITFVARNEMEHLKKIERFTGKRFELKQYPGFDYTKLSLPPEHEAGPARDTHKRKWGQQHREHTPSANKPIKGYGGFHQVRKEKNDLVYSPESRNTEWKTLIAPREEYVAKHKIRKKFTRSRNTPH